MKIRVWDTQDKEDQHRFLVLFFFFFSLFLFYSVLPVHHIHAVPSEARGGPQIPWDWVALGSAPPCGCWECKLDPLEEQPGLLSITPSLQLSPPLTHTLVLIILEGKSVSSQTRIHWLIVQDSLAVKKMSLFSFDPETDDLSLGHIAMWPSFLHLKTKSKTWSEWDSIHFITTN